MITIDNIVDLRIYRLARLNESLAAVRNTRTDAEFYVSHFENLVESCRGEEGRLVEMLREIERTCDDAEISSDV